MVLSYVEVCGMEPVMYVRECLYKYSCSILHDRCVTHIPGHSLVYADISHEGYMSCGMFTMFLVFDLAFICNGRRKVISSHDYFNTLFCVCM